MEAIILFDGVCNLCNATVQFIIKRDVNDKFKFASLQSDFGQSFLKSKKIDTKNLASIIVIEGDNFYRESTAILRIVEKLKGFQWVTFLQIVPKFIRDFVYKVISKNRYLLFGKQSSCMLPSENLKKKFIQN